MSKGTDARGPLDVYLQPAVVGGGLGDIEEVLAVGRRLERLGWTPILYRRPGRGLPRSVDGPWGWPTVRRLRHLDPRASRALTVTPWWGVSAVPDPPRSSPAGPWSIETEDIESAYGRDHVVHLSLEEFARTLTSGQQTRERWREGGVAARAISHRLRGRVAAQEVRTFHDEYRRWRAFDRSNVLHLFAGFRPSRAFAREFPEAIQSGPLWPEIIPEVRHRVLRRRWVWYASPSTSDRLATQLAIAFPPMESGERPIEIEVRGPRPIPLPPGPGLRWHWVEPSPPRSWARRFRSAQVRIVTGSRTLLEALASGGPFLYFNGVLNPGRRTRRHRPEKIETLLEVWREHRVSPILRRDLADFSRLRNVSAIVRRATSDRRWQASFPTRSASVGYPPSRADAGGIIDRWATDWARSAESSSGFVRQCRASAHAAFSRP
jgi:hypothetical protein